ncbi:MAG: hypothetical protein IKV94_05545 [Clostridia bacterium]|nr:hypothetical protein [Clostridia bacterium]
MKVKFYAQKNSVNTLKEIFEMNSNGDLKKTYMVIGNLKESGFYILEEFLIDLKARKYFLVGIDKKNTTRRMLEELCKTTKNVYVYNNNYANELNANIFVFEYSKFARVYVSSGSLSESSLITDVTCYTGIEFDLENKDEAIQYKDYVVEITKESKSEEFIAIDKQYVAKLVEDKEIFSTKQYTHNVMSISDLIKKQKEEVKEEVEEVVEERTNKVPKIDLSSMDDVSFDIDLGKEEVAIEEVVSEDIQFDKLQEKVVDSELVEDMVSEVELDAQEEETVQDEVIDMESMLFEKADIKLNKKKAMKTTEKTEEKIKSKKLDLTKVSNIFLELPSKPTKEKDSMQLKTPNYILDMIPHFFSELNSEKMKKSDEGINEKKIEINLEIVDVNSNTRYVDKSAMLLDQQNKTYIALISDKLQEIYYEEGDLARIIKLADNTYHVEIIPKTSEEYNVWKKMCTNSMRGTSRCFGMM